MRWQGQRESSNVEDRRGVSGGQMIAGGGVIGVIVLLLNMFLGGGEGGGIQLPQQQTENRSPEQQQAEDQQGKFASSVLAMTEDVWNQILPKQTGTRYEEPKLVLFSGSVSSACGFAQAAVGPFYCPGDHKLYIDLSFANELSQRFGAPGDFAMAYVVAHEVGHHIQSLLGTSAKMEQLRRQLSETEYNRYSVMLELQADFFAGVWAHYVQGKGILEAGDVEEALRAANAIGDDKLQSEAQGQVVPESFTHGTSAQRMYWFKKGFETGDVKQGDTFNSPDL